MRLDHNSRVRLIRSSLTDLRSKLTGSISIEKYDRACELIHILDSQRAGLGKRCVDSEADKKRLDDQIEHLQVQVKAKDELIDSLRDVSAASKRIAQWHGKMSKMQLEDLAIQRELSRSRESYEAGQRELKAVTARANRLEEDLVHVQLELDSKQLEWELKMDSLECKIQQYEEERDQIIMAATSPELQGSLPDRSLPVGVQLEASLRLLVERTRALKAQEVKLVTVEAEMVGMKATLRDQAMRLQRKDTELLGARLESAQYKTENSQQSENVGQRAMTLSMEREQEVIRLAEDSVNTLRRQMSRKDATIEKYRAMVTELRDELARQKDNETEELSKKTEQINDLTEQSLERFKKRAESPSKAQDEQVNHGLIEDLEKIIQAKVTLFCKCVA